MRRLLGLLVLVTLVGGGYYAWRISPRGAAGDLQGLGQRLEDLRLTASVRAALALNRRLQHSELSATAEHGRVRLEGRAPDAPTRTLAREIAAAVPGVLQVVLAVELAEAAPTPAGDDRTLGERLDDQALAGKVRLAFSLHRDLAELAVGVEVHHRRVSLRGLPAPVAGLGLRVARDVPDVLEAELF